MTCELKKKVRGWTPTPNAIYRNERLSYKAKGLWGYLNSKPEGWSFSEGRIAAEAADGRDSVNSGLKELEKEGLLVRTKVSQGYANWKVIYELKEPGYEDEFVTGKYVDEKYVNVKSRNIVIQNEVTKNEERKIKVAKATLAQAEDENEKEPLKEAYGNKDINDMMATWEKETGLTQQNTQANRRACWNLIRKYGRDQLEKLIRTVAAAQDDRYAPRISNFSALQSKQDDLILWAKKQGHNKAPAQRTYSKSSDMEALRELMKGEKNE